MSGPDLKISKDVVDTIPNDNPITIVDAMDPESINTHPVASFSLVASNNTVAFLSADDPKLSSN